MTYKQILILTLLPIYLLAQNYNGPESVEYNYVTGSYFISNSSNGQIVELDNDNELSLFASGLGTGPHGLEIVDNILYACSGGTLKGYDLNDGTQVLNYNLNAAFLNGITHMGSTLFITDFSGRTLYSYNIDLGIHTELMSFNKNPNGIYYEQYNDVLYVVFWGGNAPIYIIDYEEGTYSELISTGLGNLDGIAVDQCGDIYISAWSTNAIHKYNADFTETELVISNLSYPADICINQYDNVLAIPNSGNNTVEFIDLLCDNSETPNLFQPKKILKKIDLLGRQSTGKGFNIELYEDGSVFKKYIF